jgi:endonuclease/exonuclease/phosphatase family metal-dependent hydrolase
MIKVATINILVDTEYWSDRRNLLVAGLKEINADIIGVQEINEDKANFLVENLDMPYIYKVGDDAILSRHPFIQQEIIDLQIRRPAQFVRVEINNKQFIFCNGHYFWGPGSCQERMIEFQRLVEYLHQLPPELPIINVGDFNAVPTNPEVQFLRKHFTSAYADFNCSEPEYTSPTPLLRKQKLRHLIYLKMTDIFVNHQFKPWRGTLDYIFVSNHVRVKNCQLFLTEPSPENPRIYPSDHFGIVADLEF